MYLLEFKHNGSIVQYDRLDNLQKVGKKEILKLLPYNPMFTKSENYDRLSIGSLNGDLSNYGHFGRLPIWSFLSRRNSIIIVMYERFNPNSNTNNWYNKSILDKYRKYQKFINK